MDGSGPFFWYKGRSNVAGWVVRWFLAGPVIYLWLENFAETPRNDADDLV